MKIRIKLFIKSGILLFIIFYSTIASSQDIAKYDYAEFLVSQRIISTHKHKYVLKDITLVSITNHKDIDRKELSELKSNAEFFKYMNEKNWEYFSLTYNPSGFQIGSYSLTQYFFRKKIKSSKE